MSKDCNVEPVTLPIGEFYMFSYQGQLYIWAGKLAPMASDPPQFAVCMEVDANMVMMHTSIMRIVSLPLKVVAACSLCQYNVNEWEWFDARPAANVKLASWTSVGTYTPQ